MEPCCAVMVFFATLLLVVIAAGAWVIAAELIEIRERLS